MAGITRLREVNLRLARSAASRLGVWPLVVRATATTTTSQMATTSARLLQVGLLVCCRLCLARPASQQRGCANRPKVGIATTLMLDAIMAQVSHEQTVHIQPIACCCAIRCLARLEIWILAGWPLARARPSIGLAEMRSEMEMSANNSSCPAPTRAKS